GSRGPKGPLLTPVVPFDVRVVRLADQALGSVVWLIRAFAEIVALDVDLDVLGLFANVLPLFLGHSVPPFSVPRPMRLPTSRTTRPHSSPPAFKSTTWVAILPPWRASATRQVTRCAPFATS